MSLEKVSIHPDNCLYSEYFYSSLKTFHWLLLGKLDSQHTLTRASVLITSLFADLHRNGSFVHLEERLLSAFGEMADRLFSSQGSGSPIQVLGDVDHKKPFLSPWHQTWESSQIQLPIWSQKGHTVGWVFVSKSGDCYQVWKLLWCHYCLLQWITRF